MIIRLDKDDFNELCEYARKHLPEEACGLIAGTEENGDRLIKKVYYLINNDNITEFNNDYFIKINMDDLSTKYLDILKKFFKKMRN